MFLSPETLTEHIMGYAIGAEEMIPKLKDWVANYTTAFVPYGPDFYTGLLQAAACLLLDAQKKKMIVISEQYHDPKHLLIDTRTYWPICGKKRSPSLANLHQKSQQRKAKYASDQEAYAVDIHDYLSFVRVIMDIEECVHVGWGADMSSAQTKRFLEWAKTHQHEYVIVCLGNIQIVPSSHRGKEETYIKKMFLSPITWAGTCGEIYKKINTYLQRSIDIVAYVDANIGKKTKKDTTRYVCAVS